MIKNKLIIAAAGSGKTTYLVKEALKQQNRNILITTYTEANENAIRTKIIKENKYIPENITIQTWFSFLIEHGVKPFQGALYKKEIRGMLLVNEQSGRKYTNNKGFPVYYKEEEIEKHYFSTQQNIYSDKLSKFVVRCNKKSDGSVIDRLSRIFSHIYIDEAQDLAGYDLELLKLLFSSSINTILVADPRQVVYLTHNEKKFSRYSNGKIKDFILNECKSIFSPENIDETSLKHSHRNSKAICYLASKLYPNLPRNEPCSCHDCRVEKLDHIGVFYVKKEDILNYLNKFYNTVQLRLNKNSKGVFENYPSYNFGVSKGLGFERVLIFPTKDMKYWLFNNNKKLEDKTRAQLYVALTRAKYSAAIVLDSIDKNVKNEIELYIHDIESQ